ncbi:MAG: tetratricopeptide repeat protein [Promethearchaeota archaeon]
MKIFTPKSELKEVQNFYKCIFDDILSSSPDSFVLLKLLVVINTDIDTNIDRQSIESCCDFPNVENSFNILIDTQIIKKKDPKEEIYEFSYREIQDVLSFIVDENTHKYAIKYYERKNRRFKGDLLDDIEILFHRVKINPSEDLVDNFLTLANRIVQIEPEHGRLLDIAKELLVLEDKYKAPILIVVGNIFAALGNSTEAEGIYLNALDIYKNLAKKYYRIYLPYIATIQKNLGTLYVDLKRFDEAERIYGDALNSYKELENRFYGVHSPEFHSAESYDLETSYIDDLKEYNELMKKYYNIYLPNEPSVSTDSGTAGIDLELLEDIQDGSIDSIESFKALAKASYDMYLIDIAKTHSNLGLVYGQLMRFEDAEKMHLQALNIKRKMADHYPDQVLPELVLSYLDLGDLYALMERFEDAEPMFEEALKITLQLAEQNPEIYLYNVALIQTSIGNLYITLNKLGEAEVMYFNALKIFKKYARENPTTYTYNVSDVQNKLGNLFLILRNLDNAEKYLNKAFKRDPTNIEIIYNLACLESLRNNSVKALELLTKLIMLDEDYIKRVLSDDRFDNIKGLKEFKALTGS